MPVVVTGGSWLLRRHAVEAFVRTSPEVRVYVDGPGARADLAGRGAKVAVGAGDDVDTLRTVMDGAHTVCHLPVQITESGEGVGDIEWTGPEIERLTIGSLRPIVSAASDAAIRRILFVSYPGASSSASSPYLRCLGEAEDAVADSRIDHVVVRTTHAYGPSSEWIHTLARRVGVAEGRRWNGRMALWPGSGRQLIAPVLADDLAAVLAAADDREGVRSGVFGLEGPDRVTADRLAALAGSIQRGRPVAEPGGRVRRRAPNDVREEIWAADSLGDAPSAAAEFGVELTPLVDGLRRALLVGSN